MLAVSVEPHGALVSLLAGVPEPGLDGAADPDVEGKAEDGGAVGLSHGRGLVGRGIVDDDDVDGQLELPDLVDDLSNRTGLVPGGDDSDDLRPGHTAHPGAEPDEFEQPPRAMRVRVLVEHSLSRARSHLLRLSRIRHELAVRRDSLFRGLDDDDLTSGLEPAVDALVRVRHDRRARRRELEGPRGRGARHGRVRPAGHVEVHSRGRDRSREGVERNVPEQAGVADVPLEVEAAESELELGRGPRRLADHDLHPVAPELVAVSVEEDIHVFLNRLRREELRVGAPEERLRAPGTELEQPSRAAFRVRQHEVVLPGIRAVIRD